MPIYEYACAECGARFEHLTLGRRDAPPCCPACGGTKTEKLLSAPTPITSNATGGGDGAGSCASAPSCATGGGFS